ncbi:MAG: redoxin family protein [Pseudomonadota bacterium]
MTRWLAILPILALLGLGLIGTQNLLREEKPTTSLADNRLAPVRTFPALFEAGPDLVFNPPPGNRPIIVNLFASWCAPCEVEHPLLLELADTHDGQLYGILYKDAPENGRAFLSRLGNPFTAAGIDENGQGGLDFGLTGVPETFVIDGTGRVLLHVRGPLTPDRLAEIRELVDAS